MVAKWINQQNTCLLSSKCLIKPHHQHENINLQTKYHSIVTTANRYWYFEIFAYALIEWAKRGPLMWLRCFVEIFHSFAAQGLFHTNRWHQPSIWTKTFASMCKEAHLPMQHICSPSLTLSFHRISRFLFAFANVAVRNAKREREREQHENQVQSNNILCELFVCKW